MHQIAKAIEQLYASNSNEQRKEAQHWLQQFQSTPEAWKIAFDLLSTQSSNNQFFGALTLHVKISRDWNTMSSESKEELREKLIQCMLSYYRSPPFVVTKLCVAFVALTFKQSIENVQSIQAGLLDFSNRASEECFKPILLELFTVLPEEAYRAELLSSSKMKIHQEVKDCSHYILEYIQNILSLPLMDSTLDLIQKALRCFQSWIQYGLPILDILNVLNIVLQYLNNQHTFENAMEVLIELITNPGNSDYEKTICEGLLGPITSGVIKKEYDEAMDAGDEASIRDICRLTTTLAETFSEYFVCNIATSSEVIDFIQMMMGMTGFPGYFGVDEEISEKPLNFWYNLYDYLDELKFQESIEKDSLKGISDAISAVFRTLIRVLRQKAELPPLVIWQTWSTQQKNQFKNYRRELGDTMICCYHILEMEIFEIVLGEYSSIDQPSDMYLESILFSIHSISEVVHMDNPECEKYLKNIFNDNILQQVQGDFRIQRTYLFLIGSYSGWIKNNSTCLPSLLHFMLQSLQNTEVSSAATLNLRKLCDTCRHQLVDGMDWLMEAYQKARTFIKPNEKSNLIESIAEVLQALPNEKREAPLEIIVSDIKQDILICMEEITKGVNKDEAVNFVSANISCLVACSRGIQSSDEDIIDLVSSEIESEAIWRESKQSKVSEEILTLLDKIMELWGLNASIVELVASYLNNTLKSQDHILHIPRVSMIQFTVKWYQRYSHAALLDTCSRIVIAYSTKSLLKNQENQTMLREMLQAITELTLLCYTSLESLNQHPDQLYSYFKMLTQYLQSFPSAFYDLPESHLVNVLKLMLEGMLVNQRAIFGFLAELIAQDNGDHQEIPTAARRILSQIGCDVMRNLLLGISGRLPRSLNDIISEVLYKLMIKQFESSKLWLPQLMSEHHFPNPQVDLESKSNFVKSLLRIRDLKKFKEVVREFSLKCYGLENTVYAAALQV